MKKPKSETSRAKKPAAEKLATEKVNRDFLQRIRSGRYYNWGIKPRKSSVLLPTPEQLAALAARLGRTSQDDHKKLCSSALNLWFTSFEAIDLQKQCNEDYRLLAAENEAWNKKLPQPKDSEFPMTLDKFLSRLFPKLDTGERAEIFKGWLGYVLYGERYQVALAAGGDLSSLGKPTKQNITERYTEARKEPINKPRFYYLCDAILGWYPEYRAEKTSSVRSPAGLKSAASRLLGKCPDITKHDKKNLLESFSSVDQLHAADMEKLAKILKSPAKATKLKSFLERRAKAASEKNVKEKALSRT